MHLESPSKHAIGATFPGIPGIVIGRTRNIAWGVTNVGADVQDLYILEEQVRAIIIHQIPLPLPLLFLPNSKNQS